MRRAATTVALLTTMAAIPRIAMAGIGATTGSTTAVTAATWSVVATQSTSSPPPAGPLTLTVSNASPVLFQVDNAGTVAIIAMTYTVTVTSTNQNSNLTLTACSQPWTAGSCPGVSSTVATWSAKASPPAGAVANGSAIASALVPATPTKAVYVQATAANVPRSGLTATIDMSVSSNAPRQIRAASTTNS